MVISRAEFRARATQQIDAFEARGPRGFLAWHIRLLDAWLQDAGYRQAYRIMSEAEMKGSKTSGRVFVC